MTDRSELFVGVIEALASYEMDEPHDEGEEITEEVKWETILQCSNAEHSHKTAGTCVKCLSDDWIRKAEFITSRISP